MPAAATALMTASGLENAAVDQDWMENASFVNVEFLREFGLNPKNVLQYFYTSIFYARCGGPSSLNELRRKGETPAAGKDGHEFVLVFNNEEAKAGNVEMSIFVLQKLVYQDGKDVGIPYDTFYIVSGTVFKAPHIGQVFDTTLQAALHQLHQIFRWQTEDLQSKRRRICTESAASTSSSSLPLMQAAAGNYMSPNAASVPKSPPAASAPKSPSSPTPKSPPSAAPVSPKHGAVVLKRAAAKAGHKGAESTWPAWVVFDRRMRHGARFLLTDCMAASSGTAGNANRDAAKAVPGGPTANAVAGNGLKGLPPVVE